MFPWVTRHSSFSGGARLHVGVHALLPNTVARARKSKISIVILLFLEHSANASISRFPTSGGQYHFVAMLSPPKYSVFLSWYTGMCDCDTI
jgi:hypothetical protein